MKGVILAGGTGSRLYPCTKVTNKHLLPIYDKPMIYYPLKTLVEAGIKDILIVSGIGHAGDFVNLLGSGKEFDIRLNYEIQDEAGGIAQALALAEGFSDNESVIVILGDNIFEDNIKKYVQNFDVGCKIFLKEVGIKAAKRFGVAVVENNKVVNVEEKPVDPKSNLAMTGLYLFDSNIFNVIKKLRPSARGELEITDAINFYVKNNMCTYNIINGYWSDAGTFDSLNRASNLVKEKSYNKDSFWSDTENFSELFKFPSREDDYSTIIEKLSELSKRQAQVLDYILNQKNNGA